MANKTKQIIFMYQYLLQEFSTFEYISYQISNRKNLNQKCKTMRRKRCDELGNILLQ